MSRLVNSFPKNPRHLGPTVELYPVPAPAPLRNLGTLPRQRKRPDSSPLAGDASNAVTAGRTGGGKSELRHAECRCSDFYFFFSLLTCHAARRTRTRPKTDPRHRRSGWFPRRRTKLPRCRQLLVSGPGKKYHAVLFVATLLSGMVDEKGLSKITVSGMTQGMSPFLFQIAIGAGLTCSLAFLR